MGGGKREPKMIPYGRQTIDDDDIAAVVDVLKSDWLTTGPKVEEFEEAVAGFVGAKYAVAVSSGTAALHAAMFAIGIGPGDEVIVPPMTFAATANCIVYQGGTPLFADIDEGTLLIDPKQVGQKVAKRTKAVIAVDYAGQPCDYDALRSMTDRHGLALIADGCHALGAKYKGAPVGSVADMTCFSFHPVKHITTGEGGMVTTDNAEYAARMRMFRNHGIAGRRSEGGDQRSDGFDSDFRPSGDQTWFYEMTDLGYNYRITDIQCALGLSQLKKLPEWLAGRRQIAGRYDKAFANLDGVSPLSLRPDFRLPPSALSSHAYHLYVVRIDFDRLGKSREQVMVALKSRGVGSQVHYIPIHLHPFYQSSIGARSGLCPVAEAAYSELLSLPMFPSMGDDGTGRVIAAVQEVVNV